MGLAGFNRARRHLATLKSAASDSVSNKQLLDRMTKKKIRALAKRSYGISLAATMKKSELIAAIAYLEADHDREEPK